MDASAAALVKVLREEGPRVLATLVRHLGDPPVAEDALSEATIFTCCHPALSREAQVALALRTLARLEVDAIARAFLVPEP